MATLTIKNAPEGVVEKLKSRAAWHRRSLNLEVIASIEAVAQASPVDPESHLAAVRAARETPAGFRLTDRMLTRLRVAGRP